MAKAVEKDLVALVIKAAKLTSEAFLASVQQAIERDKQANKGKGPVAKSGKQSLKQLGIDGSQLQNIEINEANIKSFEQSAKAYNVDYALKKLPDKDNPTYVVFFKAKNAEQVNRAFKHYAYNCTHSRDKPSVKKEIGDIVKQQEQAQDKNRQRTREKAQTKGMEH